MTSKDVKEEDFAIQMRDLTVAKRNFTRKFNLSGRITAYATTTPSANAATEVRKVQARLDKAYEDIIESIDRVCSVTLEGEDLDRLEEIKQDRQSQHEDATHRIIATLNDIEQALPAQDTPGYTPFEISQPLLHYGFVYMVSRTWVTKNH